jgi:hypothetical protein
MSRRKLSAISYQRAAMLRRERACHDNNNPQARNKVQVFRIVRLKTEN